MLNQQQIKFGVMILALYFISGCVPRVSEDMRVRDINVNPPQHFGESVSDANESIDSEAAMQAQNMRQWNDFFSDPHFLFPKSFVIFRYYFPESSSRS